MTGDQLDGARDAFLALAGRRHRRPDHRVQAAQRLLDECHAQVLDRPEVPVERGRGDSDGAGDLTQAQAAQALALQQFERRVQKRLPGPLLLGLPDAGRVTHAMQLTTVLPNWEVRRALDWEVSEQV
ncbi:hypothetical protein RKD35_004940 [Streptomyces albogriseolus]